MTGVSVSSLKSKYGISQSNNISLSEFYSGGGIISPYERGLKPSGNSTVDTPVPASGTISLGNFNQAFTAYGKINFTSGVTYWTCPPDVTVLNVGSYSGNYLNPNSYQVDTVTVVPGRTYTVTVATVNQYGTWSSSPVAYKSGLAGSSSIYDPVANQTILARSTYDTEVWTFSGNVDAVLRVQVGIADIYANTRSFTASGGHVGTIAPAAQAANIYYSVYEDNHGDLGCTVTVNTIPRGNIDFNQTWTPVLQSYSGRDWGSLSLSFNQLTGILSVSQGDGYDSEGGYNISVALTAPLNFYCTYHA